MFILLTLVFSLMGESQVASLSDANLDFDEDTLKGKYTF